jgi:hypothetical protein
MSSTTIPSQEVIDQFVGNAHGNLAWVKELLEKIPYRDQCKCHLD